MFEYKHSFGCKGTKKKRIKCGKIDTFLCFFVHMSKKSCLFRKKFVPLHTISAKWTHSQTYDYLLRTIGSDTSKTWLIAYNRIIVPCRKY